MRCRGLGIAGSLAAALVLFVNLSVPPRAEASIHEIIAALCRAGGEEVVPHGQNKIDDSASFLRALQATGFITSIDTSDPTQVVINFDPTVPNSKYTHGPPLRRHSEQLHLVATVGVEGSQAYCATVA